MNKKTFIVCSLIVLTGLIIAGTYALFQWNSSTEEETILKVTVQGADIIYDGEEDITGASLNPVATKEEGIVKIVTLSLGNSTINVCADFNLELTTFPSTLAHESFKYEIYNGSTLVGEGNFAGKTEGESLKIATSQKITADVSTYTLYIWIDGENYNNPSSMQGQDFSFRFYVNAVDSVECSPSVILGDFYVDASGANAPQIFEGLIPVMWDSSNNVVKADYYDSESEYAGYDYANQKWANAVMVTSDTRETYMEDKVGTTINTSDILAYWVWIPRYNYELFNATFESGTSPQTINIEFVDTDIVERDNPTNGNMYTHPAFSFGSEEEGYTELEGFWVAKFEPSGDSSVESLKVLPGVTSYRNQTNAVFYSASQLFSNIAYLTQEGVDSTDAHMMKNTEWGAVAFLSHSVYGKNAEITINNNGDSYYTGGGTGTSYITNVGQSTTGNAYGIYDVNGNAWERVMGNLNKTAGNSGFTMANIESKYIDIYEGTTVASSIMGDALGETVGWYSDHSSFVSSSEPWFARGGYYSDGADAGAFAFGNSAGEAYASLSFRPVLSAK